jgi:acetyl esterase
VDTVCCRYEGGIHGFITMPALDLAQRARVEVCSELSRLLATVRLSAGSANG